MLLVSEWGLSRWTEELYCYFRNRENPQKTTSYLLLALRPAFEMLEFYPFFPVIINFIVWSPKVGINFCPILKF